MFVETGKDQKKREKSAQAFTTENFSDRLSKSSSFFKDGLALMVAFLYSRFLKFGTCGKLVGKFDLQLLGKLSHGNLNIRSSVLIQV